MALNIVKKLSMRVLVGDVKKLAKPLENGAALDLAKVVGIARGTKTGVSNFGDWVALTGDFVAEALVGDKVGKRYRTGTLFLPDVALSLVVPIVSGLEKGEAMELAFTVGIEGNEDANTGYIYTAAFLMEPAENDPMEALLNKAMPALPAPEAEKVDPETGEIDPVMDEVTAKRAVKK